MFIIIYLCAFFLSLFFFKCVRYSDLSRPVRNWCLLEMSVLTFNIDQMKLLYVLEEGNEHMGLYFHSIYACYRALSLSALILTENLFSLSFK